MDSCRANRLHRVRWSPFADIFQPLHMLDVAIIFSKCLANWHAARPMDSRQNNPSPLDLILRLPTFSTPLTTLLCCIFRELTRVETDGPLPRRPVSIDPMKSVCRHFPPLSLLYFATYFLSLSRTNTRSVRYTLATATRLHRIRWSPAVCRHVPPSPQLYTLYISRTDFRWVWMFVAFVHRTQIGCIGQPSRIVFLIVCSQFCLLVHGLFSRWTYNMCSASFDRNQWPWYLQTFYQNIGGKLF